MRNTLNKEKKRDVSTENEGTKYDADRPINLVPKKNNDIASLGEFPDEKYRSKSKDKGANNEDEEDQDKKPKRKIEHIRRKAPKYDARKAIENEKSKTEGGEAGTGQSKPSFSSFMKKNKEEKKEAPESKLRIIKEKDKDAEISKVKVDFDDMPINPSKKYKEDATKTGEYADNTKGEVPTRRAKVQTTEINMRKKLHEMERSPPAKLNIKTVKSKLDCWASEEQINISRVKKQTDKAGVGVKPQDKMKFEVNFLQDLTQDYKNYYSKYSKIPVINTFLLI